MNAKDTRRNPESRGAVERLLLLELGSFTCRAVSNRGGVRSFPAGVVSVATAVADSGDDTQRVVGADIALLDATTPHRIRRAAAANGCGYLCDAEAAHDLLAYVVDTMAITDVSSTGIVVSVPSEGPCECAALWAHLIFSKFDFCCATFVTPAMLRLVGLAALGDAKAVEGHGVVLDVGHSRVTATPFVAFRPLSAVAQRIDIGGYHLSKRLEEHIAFTQVQLAGNELLVEAIKQACCAVWPLSPGRSLAREAGFKRLKTQAIEAATWASNGHPFAEKACKALLLLDDGRGHHFDASSVTDAVTFEPAVYILPSEADDTQASRAHSTSPLGRRVMPGHLTADDRSRLTSISRQQTTSTAPSLLVLFDERWSILEGLFAPSAHGGTECGLARGTALALEAQGVAALYHTAKKFDAPLPAYGVLQVLFAACAAPTIPAFVNDALQSHIVCCGGTSQAPGFAARLSAEVRARLQTAAFAGEQTVPDSDDDDAAAARPADGVTPLTFLTSAGNVQSTSGIATRDEDTVLKAAFSLFARVLVTADSKLHRSEAIADATLSAASRRRAAAQHDDAALSDSTAGGGSASVAKAVEAMVWGPATVWRNRLSSTTGDPAANAVFAAWSHI